MSDILKAGVVGDPIAHSMSPMIHRAWLEAAGIAGSYEPFHVAAPNFAAFVAGSKGGDLRGLNVTLPHKEQALALADESSLVARRSGAANLLLFRDDGSIEARNTDGIGLLAAFAEQAPDLELKTGPVVVLGAGGAARGAVAALADHGVVQVRVVNRTLARAEEIASAIPPARAYALSDVAKAFEDAVAVVNATSAGLGGTGDLDLPLEALPETAVLMDMVYKPLRTGLMARAEARGLRTVDGLAMLVGQAVPSFEAFYGVPPPKSVDVRRLCLAALGEVALGEKA